MFSHSWMIQSSVQKPLMDQSKPCAICLTPVPNDTKLWCCGQPCHTPCANKLQINLIPRRCPGCRRNVIVSTDPPHSPCVFCSIQVHNNATLRCCDKPCHPSCAMECNKPNPSPSHAPHCPNCQHAVPLSVIDIQRGTRRFSLDLEFREEAGKVWGNNRWWYGTVYENENTVTSGYWGVIREPVDTNRKTLYFLGTSQSQVIPRMKSILSCQ